MAIAIVILAAVACSTAADLGAKSPGPAREPGVKARDRPNILLIVADDLGYTDLGSYGSEIRTPHLDALAREGIRFTDFYATPMCSTTRAALLTGVDHHRAGLGNMPERMSDNQQGQPGYEGHLNDRVASLSELLQDAGYRTYLAGKWHLGSGPGRDPRDRGFDRSFALLESGAGHFANMLPLLGPVVAAYSEDGVPLAALPPDFHSSQFYARKLIAYLREAGADERPFFGYLSFTAPHFPLQAPETSVARQKGRYEAGYEALHAERLDGLRREGIAPPGATRFPLLDSERAWAKLSSSERALQARTMEIYAAMIEDLDRYVGEVIEYLRAAGLYENTVIVFLSDNGAEGHYLEWGLDPLVPWARECCDNRLENLGRANSYGMLGPGWARAAAAPFRMFKGFTSEGGIRVPAFVHFADRFPGGRINRSIVSVMDVVPTLLDIAGVESPGSSSRGRNILTIQGRSLVPVLEGRAEQARGADDYLAWEIFGKRALRQGRWKIVWENSDVWWWDSAALGIRRNTWQLYDLAADPAELHDLSSAHPQRLADLASLWELYARENGVILPDRQRGY